MSALRGDLHVHTCLSPCADDDLTPVAAVGLAKLAGADVVAVTDHNSALSLPAAKAAADAYDILLLPGIEVNCAEEIHLLCYFRDVGTALRFGEALYDALPDFPYDPAIWGRQLVTDENEQVTGEVEKLLTGAVTLTLSETAELCRSMGGVPVPAHADADSYSLFSVLGGWPMDADFDLYEVKFPDRAEQLIRAGILPGGKPVLTNSDAHSLDAVASRMSTIGEDNPLRRLF